MCRSRASGVALLADLGGLAAQFAQVVQLGPSHVTAGDDLDVVDDRAVQGERTLDPHAEADLANRERLAHTATLATDHDALEHLHTLAVALDHVDVDLDGVAGAEVGDVVAKARGVNGVQGVHRVLLAFATGRTQCVVGGSRRELTLAPQRDPLWRVADGSSPVCHTRRSPPMAASPQRGIVGSGCAPARRATPAPGRD